MKLTGALLILKKLFITFLLFLFFSKVFSNEKGLFFSAKDADIEKQTGIDFTYDDVLNYHNEFTLEFDLSVRNAVNIYGSVFKIQDAISGDEISMILKIDTDTPNIILLHNKTESDASISLNSEDKKQFNRWNHVSITVNSSSGIVCLRYGHYKGCDTLKLTSSSKLRMVFGAVKNNFFQVNETAPISVKNIAFNGGNNNNYFWPLSKTNNEYTVDSIQKRKAQLIHPHWNVTRHAFWKHFKRFEFEECPQILYNDSTEEINFISRNNDILVYNLNKNRVTSHEIKKGFPIYEDAQQVILNSKNSITTYSFQYNQLSEYNDATHEWPSSSFFKPHLPKYWHHNKLLHPINKRITTVCGYGFYTYNNKLLSYNENSKMWEKLTFRGDSLIPRYLSSLGKSTVNKNEYYLFGGIGNKQSKQILGENFLYDLNKINFKKNTIEKIWKMKTPNTLNFTPCNSLIVNEEESSFYTLVHSHLSNNTHLKLLKGSLNSPSIEFVADSIPYLFSDISSFSDLYFWKSNFQFIALTSHLTERGKYEVNLFSLNFPPSNYISYEKTSTKKVYLFIAVGSVLFFLSILFIKRNYQHSTTNDDEKINIESLMIEQSFNINIWGGFKVFNKTGQDITYRFSSTLKELFLIILISGIDHKKGISSKDIQEYIWPDKSHEKAKNNRGVNINRLRGILDDLEKIQLIYDGHYWLINLGKEITCEYKTVTHILQDEDSEDFRNNLYRILPILKKGKFLFNTESEWFDQKREDMTNRIINFLEEQSDKLSLKDRLDSLLLLEITQIIFLYDLVNEYALKTRCKVLVNQGKHSLALENYENFKKHYFSIYKEEYLMSFKSIIS
ncbi:hypothetical protein [uncultured Draconibacterium sp.]|uniref:hypothetical protein n=1 Tax=uncultured Draconibacterium sp. TaxID=1573823 RepID=UPI0029C0F25B|nr:hypothetical protein [uncultured Draconibacterium sp.]